MVEKKYSYISEIQTLMRMHGDYENPLRKSAEFIEDVLRQQMNSLLIQASDIAVMRGSEKIGHQDILFLMRKDQIKLHRILKYLKYKDRIKSPYKLTDDAENSDNNETTSPTWHFGETSLSECETKKKSLSTVEDPMQFDQDTEMESEVQLKTRFSQCFEFLNYIDEIGELYDVLHDTGIFDKKEMQVIRNRLGISLNCEQYFLNEEERQLSSAIDTFTTSSFKTWLYQDNVTDLKLTPLAFEMFAYLAHATVTTVITLALSVKQSAVTDLLERLQPLSLCRVRYLDLQQGFSIFSARCSCLYINHYAKKRAVCECCKPIRRPTYSTYPDSESSTSPPSSPDALLMQSSENPYAIQPYDIVEVLNRFYNRSSLFSFEETSSRNKKAKQLFCC